MLQLFRWPRRLLRKTGAHFFARRFRSLPSPIRYWLPDDDVLFKRCFGSPSKIRWRASSMCLRIA